MSATNFATASTTTCTTTTSSAGRPTRWVWLGRVTSALVTLFLIFDGVLKVMEVDIALKTTVQLGYPEHVVFGLGVLTLVIAALYAVPRTAVLGAILLTGLLGGAMATHLRVGSPVFSHLLFGLYLGLLAWGGLYLRDARLRALIPLRQPASN